MLTIPIHNTRPFGSLCQCRLPWVLAPHLCGGLGGGRRRLCGSCLNSLHTLSTNPADDWPGCSTKLAACSSAVCLGKVCSQEAGHFSGRFQALQAAKCACDKISLLMATARSYGDTCKVTAAATRIPAGFHTSVGICVLDDNNGEDRIAFLAF